MKVNIKKTKEGKFKINYGTTLYKTGEKLLVNSTKTALSEEYLVEHVNSKTFNSVEELNMFISELESNLKKMIQKESE